MFGNLFEDEELGNADDTSSSRYSKYNGIEAPPRPRLKCNLAGITNQGATCYLNSLIQTLLLTPEFRESLFKIPKHELGNLEDKEKPGSKVRVIPLQLQRLFARLLLSNRQSVSTKELTESFGWSNNEGLQQHDVQELNRILFTAISESLAGTSGTRLIQDLYHGTIVNQIKCMECEACSERNEDFLDLTLTISGNTDLKQALFRYYQETELLDGKNQYKCEKCDKLVNASKGAKLRKLPPILSISLLRFSYDFQKMERYKESGRFSFPLVIDMSLYSDQSSGCDEYELFSVVIHRGGAYGGHYHAYIKDVDDLGTWFNPDEEKITLTSNESNAKDDKELLEIDSPLQLITTLLRDEDNQPMDLDKLGAEIKKRTGKSWSNLFKGSYGQMRKFIRKNDDVFTYNPENTVSLKKGACIIEEPQVNEKSSQENKENCPVNENNEESGKSCLPRPGQCWYDFDDSQVSPILIKDIEKQFQGKESAYMLFYRQKKLTRPPEARNNPRYCITDHLLKEVDAENTNIELEKFEYEEKISKVTLQIHFGLQYEIGNNVVSTRQDSLVPWLELTFDRRLTITELIAAIFELGGELVSAEPVLSRLTRKDNGLNIVECLSDDPCKSLTDMNILDGEMILVWDGKQSDTPPVFTIVLDGDNSNDLSLEFTKSDASKTEIDSNDTLQETSNCDNTSSAECGKNETTSNISVIVNSKIRITFGLAEKITQLKSEEITLSNTLTVGECLDAIILESGLPGENYHLRKTNWCGEPATVLDSLETTLSYNQIHDGDHLLIEMGRLPGKGYCILSLYLHPTLKNPKISTSNNMDMVTWITNEIKDLLIGDKTEKIKKTVHMGDVEILKDSYLVELKTMIMNLPNVNRLQLNDIQMLRVRRLEGNKPTVVLRDNMHSLKRHKIKSCQDIAIQVLPGAEYLSTSEIVLEVKQRIPQTKMYEEPVEVIWDISTGSGIEHLQRTIVDALSLQTNNILLAKHNPEKHEWHVIKEEVSKGKGVKGSQKKGKKKKKMKVEKVNLRQSPYYISDGDVIAVKILDNCDEENVNDFSTVEDILGRMELDKIAEEKRKKRKQERETFPVESRHRPREAALTIKVENFT